MVLLSRDDILGAQDMVRESVDVPEWGGTVLVSSLSGVDRDAWDQSLVTMDSGKARTNMDNIRARLVALCLVDESGAKLFKASDLAALGRKSGAALSRVFAVAQRLNGLAPESVEAAKGN